MDKNKENSQIMGCTINRGQRFWTSCSFYDLGSSWHLPQWTHMNDYWINVLFKAVTSPNHTCHVWQFTNAHLNWPGRLAISSLPSGSSLNAQAKYHSGEIIFTLSKSSNTGFLSLCQTNLQKAFHILQENHLFPTYRSSLDLQRYSWR